MLRRFAHVDMFSWAQQAFDAKIPAPVEDARILKVARFRLTLSVSGEELMQSVAKFGLNQVVRG